MVGAHGHKITNGHVIEIEIEKCLFMTQHSDIYIKWDDDIYMRNNL